MIKIFSERRGTSNLENSRNVQDNPKLPERTLCSVCRLSSEQDLSTLGKMCSGLIWSEQITILTADVRGQVSECVEIVVKQLSELN